MVQGLELDARSRPGHAATSSTPACRCPSWWSRRSRSRRCAAAPVCSSSSCGQGRRADLLLALDEHRHADGQVIAQRTDRGQMGSDPRLVIGSAAARTVGRRARSARTARSPSRRVRRSAGRHGARRAGRSGRRQALACARSPTAGRRAQSTSCTSKPSAANKAAVAVADRRTSSKRAGSALTDGIRTRSSRSLADRGQDRGDSVAQFVRRHTDDRIAESE